MDPYKPPKHLQKDHEQFTSAERKEWLKWYCESQPLRDEICKNFNASAVVSMGAALLAIPSMLVIYEIVNWCKHYFGS